MAAWTVRLTRQAEHDVLAILTWTEARFGSQQADVYKEVLALALEALVEGPDVIGVQERNDIYPDIRGLHVGRYGKRGRHHLVFKASEGCSIDVLRILHDSMDPVRHMAH